MPRGDRTGPMGMGPTSGRGAGYCTNNRTPGFMNRFFGRGAGTAFRWGQGRSRGGFGWRDAFRGFGFRQGYGRQDRTSGWNRFGLGGYSGQSNMDAGVEKQYLEDQVSLLKSQLDVLQQRLNDLGSGKSEKAS